MMMHSFSKTPKMALLSLRISPPLHLHLSLPFSKPSPIKPTLSFPLSLSINKGTQRTLLFPQTLSSLATQTTTQEEEEVRESVESFDRRRLIAQNIPWTSTAEDIRSLFEKHGTVLDVELSMYNGSRNRGLAFITMASEEEAVEALNNLNSYDLDGRVIKVEFSTSLKKIPSVTEVPIQKYNVYVGNLGWRVRSRDLQELFNANGKVLSAEVIFQGNPRRSAGYGFVSFASEEDAEAAISSLNGKRFMGRSLRLGLSKLRTDDAERKSSDNGEFGVASTEVNTNKEIAN